MTDILVLAEHQDGKVKKFSLELVSKACDLAGKEGGSVSVILIGAGVESLSGELAPYGADKVAIVSSPVFEKYNTMAYATAMACAVSRFKPGIVLATASPLGRDLLPRLAARLKAGMASDCVDLDISGGKLVAKKPVYSGRVLVKVVFSSDLQLATTRPNLFPVGKSISGKKAEVITLTPDVLELVCPLKETIRGAVLNVDLTEAEVVVSGGRAMTNAENFRVLRELADVLGGAVGASRAAVDSGYAPHSMQVGQTGKVVNPKLYIACGISGAIQHLAGMSTSKVIVAINKDPEAQIFSKADYGIVGDLFTVVPLITAECKKILSE